MCLRFCFVRCNTQKSNLMKTCFLPIFLLILLCSCSPVTKLLKEHRYLAAFDEATERLKSNPESKNDQQKLQQVYSLALTQFQSELSQIQSGRDSLKWVRTFELMQQQNELADKIKANPQTLMVISNPKTYMTELEAAKAKAVEEMILRGKFLLNQNSRAKARESYFLFGKAQTLSPDQRDIHLLIENARVAATFNVIIDPVRIDFNTLNVSTKKIDKELFYWTQRDVSSRQFIRLYTADDADKQGVDPDFFVQISVLDYRVDKMSSGQSGTSNLMAIGNLQVRIYKSGDQKLVFRKNISCRYDSETKSTIRVNTIDLQRVIDPDIQTFFDYMILSNFDRLTEEIDNYFNTLVKQ